MHEALPSRYAVCVLSRFRRALANGHPEQTSDGVVVRPFEFLDNPIDDATAVHDLPLLANVTTHASRMTMSFVAIDGDAPRMSGRSTRLESSNRFDLGPAEGGPPVRLIQATFLHITRPAAIS